MNRGIIADTSSCRITLYYIIVYYPRGSVYSYIHYRMIFDVWMWILYRTALHILTYKYVFSFFFKSIYVRYRIHVRITEEKNYVNRLTHIFVCTVRCRCIECCTNHLLWRVKARHYPGTSKKYDYQ